MAKGSRGGKRGEKSPFKGLEKYASGMDKSAKDALTERISQLKPHTAYSLLTGKMETTPVTLDQKMKQARMEAEAQVHVKALSSHLSKQYSSTQNPNVIVDFSDFRTPSTIDNANGMYIATSVSGMKRGKTNAGQSTSENIMYTLRHGGVTYSVNGKKYRARSDERGYMEINEA